MFSKNFKRNSLVRFNYKAGLFIAAFIFFVLLISDYSNINSIKLFALISGFICFNIIISWIFASDAINKHLIQTKSELKKQKHTIYEVIEKFEEIGILFDKKYDNIYIFNILDPRYKGYRVVLYDQADKYEIIGPQKAIHAIESRMAI